MSAVTREAWLNAALVEIATLLHDKAGVTLPADCRVSVGFPGGGSARKRIGECWPRSRSSIGVNEIFISPVLQDRVAMMDVLVHEAIHAADDCKSGHKAPFKRVALAVGLTGKMKSTVAGPELRAWIDATIAVLPALDHGALSLEGRTKQATRMLKLECRDCGYTVRTTAKWIECGLPTCACGGEFIQN
jgi:hypothetical protein